MSEKYKIGTIAKLLGIPIQTLHYYESCGFVAPSKDEHSNYRYYNAWDVNYLLDCKHLRSFEFSNAQIKEMINHDDIKTITEKFDAQEKRLLDLIYYYQTILDTLHEEKQQLDTFKQYIGTFTVADNPQLYFNPYRLNNQYQSDEASEEIPEINDWLSHLPFVKATFKIRFDHVTQLLSDDIDYWWGFSISPKKARELHLPVQGHCDYIPSKSCVYTVFCAEGENTFTSSFREKVQIPIKKKGYQVIGAPLGRLIIRFHENGQFKRYFEVWIPIN